MKGSYFSEDVKDFLGLLHHYEVKYVIVGGEAVIYYGYPRLTGDIDFFYNSDSHNSKSLFNALLEFWEQNIPGIDNYKQLQSPGYVIQFGTPPNRIDLINNIDGVSFEEVWEGRKTESLFINNKKIPVNYIGLTHLIINKRHSGRNKDAEDLNYLEKI